MLLLSCVSSPTRGGLSLSILFFIHVANMSVRLCCVCVTPDDVADLGHRNSINTVL